MASAAVILEIVAYLAYHNAVDGQTVFANAAILLYAIPAMALVWIADVFIRAVRSYFAKPS